MEGFGPLWSRVDGRRRARSARLVAALAGVATLAAVVAATAGALAFDDQRPCPAAYTENESGEPLPPPPFVCPQGTVGTPYAVQLVGHGSCEPYFRFMVLGGALPPGVSLSSGGLLSGTPARAGSWTFWVRAQDLGPSDGGPAWCSSADQADGEFVITVHPGVVVTTEAATPGTVGTPYELPLSAQTASAPNQLAALPGCSPAESPFGSCPLTWSIVQGQLPGGLRLNPVTGKIFGTPTAEGTFSFVVLEDNEVSDNGGAGVSIGTDGFTEIGGGAIFGNGGTNLITPNKIVPVIDSVVQNGDDLTTDITFTVTGPVESNVHVQFYANSVMGKPAGEVFIDKNFGKKAGLTTFDCTQTGELGDVFTLTVAVVP